MQSLYRPFYNFEVLDQLEVNLSAVGLATIARGNLLKLHSDEKCTKSVQLKVLTLLLSFGCLQLLIVETEKAERYHVIWRRDKSFTCMRIWQQASVLPFSRHQTTLLYACTGRDSCLMLFTAFALWFNKVAFFEYFRIDKIRLFMCRSTALRWPV